jgi:dihydroorotate dehydrogenase (fumarate)
MFITNLAGSKLTSFIYNASGVNNQILPQLKKIADSASGAVTLKSTSVDKWQGNPAPNYIVKSKLIPGATLNCMGIPNEGIDATIEFMKQLRQYTNKPIIPSIFSLGGMDQYYEMMDKLEANKDCFDMLEVNVSCPNIPGKPLLAYDMEAMESLLIKMQKYTFKKALKLPPYFDMSQFDKISCMIVKYKIDVIVVSNTIGNCLVINPETETTVLKPKNGMGGLGGDYIKPLALGNVWNFWQRLQGKVQIVGVGGVRTGTDAFEFMLAGADAVQTGTTWAQEGIASFERIAGEFDAIMAEHGYASIQAARGKLKVNGEG